MTTFIPSARSFWTDERRRSVLIVTASLAVAIVFAYWNALADLWYRWGNAQELSHSYFLPGVAAWILWERRAALRQSLGSADTRGFIGLGAGLAMLLAGELINVPMFGQFGFVVVLLSLPLLLGGWSLALLCALPLAYLFFMVPPPFWVITRMSQGFQFMSSELGVAMIRMAGITVHLAGNVIHLPSTTLAVVDACSGLRYLFPFLCLGALAAYFYKGPLWQRGLILLSTIPITILMNSFRIAMTGILIENFGGNHTEGFVHMFEGWMVFVLCIMLLLGVIWVFTLMRGRRTPFAYVGFEDVDPIAPRAPFDLARTVRYGAIAAAVTLAAGILAHSFAARAPVIPERQDLATLPLEFPEWRSQETILDPVVLEVLGADDYIVVDMVGPNGDQVNFFAAYLNARRDGRSWHSPLQCLPGGGWEIREAEIVEVQSFDGRTYPINQLIIRQNDNQFLMNYWYDQRGRQIANEFTMRLWVMWDDLLKRRSDGAMVRLLTPLEAGETMADAQERLTELRMEPVLPKYIPH